MKKTIIICFVILAGGFVLLSLLDNGSYTMEKRLWQAQKQYEQLARDPKAVPDQSFDALIARYRKILARYPDASLTPRIYIKIGKIYLLRKNYPQARATFDEALKKYPRDEEVQANALMQIGSSYEIENNFDAAVATYKKIVAEYPRTAVGKEMPLYIINYAIRSKKLDESRKSVEAAIAFYKRSAAESPESFAAFNAGRFLAAAYFAKQDWKSGIDILGGLITKFSESEFVNPQQLVLLVKTINTTSVASLNNYDIPIGIYQDFINRHPGHRFTPYLQKVVSALVELKDKQVGLQYKPAAQTQE